MVIKVKLFLFSQEESLQLSQNRSKSFKALERLRVGVMVAKAAGMKVVAVSSIQTQANPLFRSGFYASFILEFQPEPWGLSAFEDWVMNALPIEGLLQKGFLCEVADDGPSSLADQVSGIYFGWVKLNTDEILKVVVGIG
ncbi:hypothetical protein GIB67_011432 [Kingdonia uniflora]|uniref:Uncharacterized protein n=1 Tax=Kingdonia uniflora TaxID=39325 RepID=A0A7J7NLG9_9MAGN|nr:hypothetical protein GIB67_011432 [Kingdonia uniflora]